MGLNVLLMQWIKLNVGEHDMTRLQKCIDALNERGEPPEGRIYGNRIIQVDSAISIITTILSAEPTDSEVYIAVEEFDKHRGIYPSMRASLKAVFGGKI